MLERLVSSSDMLLLHFAFGQSSSFVKQWSRVKQSELGKTFLVSSRFIKCSQVFRATKLPLKWWQDMAGHVRACWGSGCPFPPPAQQQNRALVEQWAKHGHRLVQRGWNMVNQCPAKPDHGITWSCVFLLPSHPQSCLKCFWWKIEREALAAVQVHKNHRPQHSLCTALCVLCACSSAKFGNHWDRFSGTLYQRELFRGELPSTMPQYRLFEKQGVFAKKSSCRNTVSRKMFVSSWVRMIAVPPSDTLQLPSMPHLLFASTSKSAHTDWKMCKDRQMHETSWDTSMSCWTTSASPDFRFFLSSACILRQRATAKYTVAFLLLAA